MELIKEVFSWIWVLSFVGVAAHMCITVWSFIRFRKSLDRIVAVSRKFEGLYCCSQLAFWLSGFIVLSLDQKSFWFRLWYAIGTLYFIYRFKNWWKLRRLRKKLELLGYKAEAIRAAIIKKMGEAQS